MSKKQIRLLLGIFSFFGVCVYYIFFYISATETRDPLSSFFDISHETKADFLTHSLSPFSGDISLFSSCIASSPKTQQKGIVYALVNSQKVLEMLGEKEQNLNFKKEVKAELDYILGHAFRNSELNWAWREFIREALQLSSGDTQYLFYTTPGEEALWYCYFTTGPEFFQKFFYSQTVTYRTHDENFSVAFKGPLQGDSLQGFAPWGANVVVITDAGQQCETWADENNTFACSFSDNFTEKELIRADIIDPEGIPYRIHMRQGDAKSLDCVLDSGLVDECQVQ